MLDEHDEGKLFDRAADHDVRRVADERRRAADVRGDDLREEVGHGVQLQNAGDAKRYRHHEEHSCHIIEKGGKHRRNKTEIDEDAARLCLGGFCRLDGHIIKKPRLLRHTDEHHHTDEEPQRFKVHMVQRRLL